MTRPQPCEQMPQEEQRERVGDPVEQDLGKHIEAFDLQMYIARKRPETEHVGTRSTREAVSSRCVWCSLAETTTNSEIRAVRGLVFLHDTLQIVAVVVPLIDAAGDHP